MNDFQPELRAGPPWVMDEMIAAQADLPELIAGGSAAGLLAQRIAETAQAGEPITVCGCGTSEHAARAIFEILQAAGTASRLDVRDSFEAQLAPPEAGLFIAVSHSGDTAATLGALRRASARGARAVLITASSTAPPENVEAAVTPLQDLSWCHTVAYTSPILLCALGAGFSAQAARSVIDREIGDRAQRHRDAAALLRCSRLLPIGSGVDEVTASELALKIEEAAHVPCTPLGIEKVLHGHLPAADRHTGVVLIRFDPREAQQRDTRAADVAGAVGVLDMPTITLAMPGLTDCAEALLAGALAAQLLTVELATALGTNPDLIRREDPLYLKVAQAAKAG